MNSGTQSDCARENHSDIVSQLAQHDTVPWYRKPNLRLLYFLILPACVGVDMTAGFDASMINGLQAVPSWLAYFHHPHSALLGIMVAAYSLGSAIGIPFVPLVVDRTGRRYPIFLGGIAIVVGGIIQGSALNAMMFIIARFILGLAAVFSIVAASTLIGELSHPKERFVVGCLFSTSYNFGAVVAAGLTFGTFAMENDWGWRIPSIFQAVLGLIQVTFIYFLPESPRWLISRGRRDEAYAVLVKYHAEGDDRSEFVKAEYTQIEQTLKANQAISQTHWRELFSTPGMRKRTAVSIFLGLSLHWCGFGLMAHYFAPILDSIGIHDDRTKNIIMFCRVSWSFVVSVAAVYVAPRCPRRRMFLTCAVAFFVLYASWTIVGAEYSINRSEISAQTTLIVIFLFSAAYNLGFPIIMSAFLVELFPFHVRTKGISIHHWWRCIAGFISNAINPIGINIAGWKWYFVYCVWNAFSILFIYIMIPETSGRTLEELAFLYESDQEVIKHSEVETLRGDRGSETYGTMQDWPGGSRVAE